jgi:hypothetical protein
MEFLASLASWRDVMFDVGGNGGGIGTRRNVKYFHAKPPSRKDA